MATFSGKATHIFLARRKRATMSASEQQTRKYSWTKRNAWPATVESSGYNTRVTVSAAIRSTMAPTKSPELNSPKSKKSGEVADQSRSVLMFPPP